MRIFLLGATGHAGGRILKSSLRRGHQVTALVRNPKHLTYPIMASARQLVVLSGDIQDYDNLSEAISGHDVVINAAGHVNDGERFTELVKRVVDAAEAGLGAGGRFWQFGGAALLNVPGTEMIGLDLPLVPRMYEAHRTNLQTLERSALDWSMLCPGPMIDAPSGEATAGLRLSVDRWPTGGASYNHYLPAYALTLAFRDIIPELTISYEDAAQVVLDNLDREGEFKRRRVGVALPIGMRNVKSA